MNENEPTNPAVDPTVEAHETPAESVVDVPADEPDAPQGNREARYRVERNEARTERDALAARVESFQLREVERLAGVHLSVPADLLVLAGVTVEELLDDDGDVDPEKVTAVALDLVASRPGLKPRTPAVDPSQGAVSPPVRRQPTMLDLLKS